MAGKLVYLTIDLDYWNNEATDHALNILKRLRNNFVATKVYAKHRHIVKDIPINCDHILNIDEHDDIFDRDSLTGPWKTLKDDNWANFVRQRTTALYEWRFPKQYYHCDHRNFPWVSENVGWKAMKAHYGLLSLPWTKIYRASIVISEDYTHMNTLFALVPVLKQFEPASKAVEKLIKSYCQKPKEKICQEMTTTLRFPIQKS